MNNSTKQGNIPDMDIRIYEPIVTKPLPFVLWIAIFLSAVFAVPHLIDIFYKHWLGDGIWMTSSAFSCVPLLAIIVYFIMELVFFIEPEDTQDSTVRRKDFSKKEKALMVVIPLAAAILLSVLSLFRFHAFSSTGVESICFGERTEYTWEDVTSYTLDDDWYGQLIFKLEFRDGSHAQFIGGLGYLSWYTSTAFDTQYPDEDADYAKYLAKELAARNIPANVDDWDALIDDLRYDYYKELAAEIKEIAYKD